LFLQKQKIWSFWFINLNTVPLTSICEDKTDKHALGALCSPRPDAADLRIDLCGEARELIIHRDAFAVGVEADEHELPTPVHDHIVIAMVLVLDTIPHVRALVGLDADQRVPDAPAVVDAPPLRAIARVGRFNVFVVAKILEVFVNEGLCLRLFEAV
jgi:hypothetical protein